MIFKLGDKFLVEGIEGEVKFINNGIAVLFPVNEGDFFRGSPVIKGLAFTKIDEKGRLDTGKKAIPLNKSNSVSI